MKLFLTMGVVVATFALGGCVIVAPGRSIDMEAGESPAQARELNGAMLQRHIRHKYEYVDAINSNHQDALVELRSRLELRQISYKKFLAEKAQLEAQKAEQRYEMEKNYEAELNSGRSISCHTTGRRTVCD